MFSLLIIKVLSFGSSSFPSVFVLSITTTFLLPDTVSYNLDGIIGRLIPLYWSCRRRQSVEPVWSGCVTILNIVKRKENLISKIPLTLCGLIYNVFATLSSEVSNTIICRTQTNQINTKIILSILLSNSEVIFQLRSNI